MTVVSVSECRTFSLFHLDSAFGFLGSAVTGVMYDHTSAGIKVAAA